MWNKSISVGCVAMCAAWMVAFGLIVAGGVSGNVYVAHLGLGTSALAATLAIVRDNQRTRSQLRSIGRRGGGDDETVRHLVRPDRY